MGSNDPSATAQPGWRRLAGTLLTVAVLATVVASASPVDATEGYFSNGYGIKSKGRAGVSLAQTDDAFGGANNPATFAWGANRVDLGLDWFHPLRGAERTGPAASFNGRVDSDSDNYFIPELGFKYAVSDDVAVGITVYGNGGMDTDYKPGQLNLGPGANNLNLLAGSGCLGVDLTQLLVAPTVAWKFAPNQSVGLAPLLGYQWFKAYGLGSFSAASQSPAELTDRGYDQAFGVGVRIGYLCNLTPDFTVAAAYSSPVFMQPFKKYRGLFANDGSFDIPQNVGVGLGWQVLPMLRLGVDYRWIDYAGVAAVGNSSDNAGLLGQGDGPGFGWRSISVVKVGADWQVAEGVVLRGGYSFNENPIDSGDVTINILSLGVIQHHLTCGGTFAFGRQEVSLAYMHGFFNSVTGESRFATLGQAPAGTRERISMFQDSLGVQYSFKF